MTAQPAPILTADSITRIGPEAKGAVVVNGSHGGVYAAYVAAKLGVAAAIFNDAGIGRDEAGIAGLDYPRETRHTGRRGRPHDRAHRRRCRYDGARRDHPRQSRRDRTRLPRRPQLRRRRRGAGARADQRKRAAGSARIGVSVDPRAAGGVGARLGLGGQPRACRDDRRDRLAWRAVGRKARDRAQIRRACSTLQRCRHRRRRRRRDPASRARCPRHRRRHRRGKHRPHWRRPLDLRGWYRIARQFARRGTGHRTAASARASLSRLSAARHPGASGPRPGGTRTTGRKHA